MHGGFWNRLPFKELPVVESCELRNKGSAVGEKTFIAGTEITQSCFAIGCLQDAILGAPAITHGQDLASTAITGQSIMFGLPEGSLHRAFDEADQLGLLDIAEMMFSVNKVIT